MWRLILLGFEMTEGDKTMILQHLDESQLVECLGCKSIAHIPSPNLTPISPFDVTLLDLIFWLIDVTIMCWINDVRPIDFWPKDVVSKLAYCSAKLIMAVKRFMLQGSGWNLWVLLMSVTSCGQCDKLFFSVINVVVFLLVSLIFAGKIGAYLSGAPNYAPTERVLFYSTWTVFTTLLHFLWLGTKS